MRFFAVLPPPPGQAPIRRLPAPPAPHPWPQPVAPTPALPARIAR